MSEIAMRNAATSGRRRFAGFDRGTVKPALLVLALAVLMSVVLPAIDASAPYRDAVRQGDVIEIADGVTMVPTPGWELASGALVSHTRSPVSSTGSTELVDGGVDFEVQAAPFAGSPSALLSRVNEIDAELEHARGGIAGSSDRYAVTTAQGVVGVAEDFVGVKNQGSIVAFVLPPGAGSRGSVGEGVEIVVSGPRGSLSRRRDEIVAMIRSLRAAS